LPSPPNEQRKVDVGRTIGEINEILGGWVRTYYQVGRIVLASFAMPAITTAQPLSPLADLAPGAVCPLDRVAIVRGSDSEARQGGGFYAARKNGIHGAVDLNGALGEPVYAVASGKVLVAARSDWGKLGRTVVVDHRDGGYTVYGHLNSVEVNVNSDVTAGQPIGTIGYSGNAAGLQKKNLPPHLHFAYFRNVTGVDGRVVPLARIRDSGDGIRASYAKDAVLADVAGIVNPLQAVRFLPCWEDPPPPRTTSTRSTSTMPR
jgi:murein DD-endopeptidase MepM/ murein hydrolase activator NlpD